MDTDTRLDDKFQVDMLCLFAIVSALFIMVVNMMNFIIQRSATTTALELVLAIFDMFVSFVLICTVYGIQRGSKVGWWTFIIQLLLINLMLIPYPFDIVTFLTLIVSVLLLSSVFARPIRRHCGITFKKDLVG